MGLVTAQLLAHLNAFSLKSCSPLESEAITAGRKAASVHGGVVLLPPPLVVGGLEVGVAGQRTEPVCAEKARAARVLGPMIPSALKPLAV